MPLTNAEFAFLDAYVHEVYTPAMTGPPTLGQYGDWEPISRISAGF